MKIEIEFTLRCTRCLNVLSVRQNYHGSTTLYNVDPCQKCIEELAQKLKGENDGNKEVVNRAANTHDLTREGKVRRMAAEKLLEKIKI